MRALIISLLSALFFTHTACRTDFEVNEPWKEIDIIYGLLDVNDSVQYIKINKAFLNENEDVYKLASIEDSLFHQDSLDVRLQAVKNNSVVEDIKLSRTYVSGKDSGIFAYPGQFLFRTPSGYVLRTDVIYKLIVENTVTGNTARSESSIVQNAKLVTPSPNSPSLNFYNDPASKFPISFRTGLGARFYDLTLVIKYEEYRKSDNVKIKDGVINWPVFSNLFSNPTQDSEVKYVVNGTDFFRVLAQALKEDAGIYRKLPTKPFEYKLAAGGAEIFNYMQVNRPGIGIVQKKPEYTNIENGYGIFSSRNRQVLYLEAGSRLRDDLINSPMMKPYGFR